MLVDDGLEILAEDDCRALLTTQQVGRVVVTLGAIPAVLPVNYLVRDNAIVFATGDGLKLRAALDHAVVAFEVDEFDVVARKGWSVLVVGRAVPVEDDAERERAFRDGLEPWAPGPHPHLVRVDTEFLSGRRFGSGRGPAEERDQP